MGMKDLLAGTFILVLIIGYILNVYKLVVECDFDTPLKCEAIRTVGVIAAPIGSIVGYIDINDDRMDK